MKLNSQRKLVKKLGYVFKTINIRRYAGKPTQYRVIYINTNNQTLDLTRSRSRQEILKLDARNLQLHEAKLERIEERKARGHRKKMRMTLKLIQGDYPFSIYPVNHNRVLRLCSN